MNSCRIARFSITAVFFVLLACVAFPLHAKAAEGATFVEDGVTYAVTSESGALPTASVGTGNASDAMTTMAGALAIPEKVSHDGVSYTVTAIGNYAFSASAKAGAEIESVELPASLTTIGSRAFNGCQKLKSVKLAQGSELQTIGDFAFAACPKLEAFSVPESVASIGMYAFSGCESLAEFSFENPEAPEPALVLNEGVLKSGALKAITFPARLVSVPSNALMLQDSLEEVRFTGKRLASIGSYAFYGCSSVRHLELPALTSKGNELGTNPLYGMDELREIVFLADQAYELADTSFLLNLYSTYQNLFPPVETVVYYGDHESALFAEANHYQRVCFYANEQDAAAQSNSTGNLFVRDDVPLRAITASQGASDEKGKLVYAGEAPALAAGETWCFLDVAPSSYPTKLVSAYPAASNDLKAGEIELEGSEAMLVGGAADLCYKVFDAAGNELVEGVDYTIRAFDEAGSEVSASSISNAGNYTLVAQAKAGGKYAGSVSVDFSVSDFGVSWLRASGNARYSTPNHMADTAFAQGKVDTVILVSESLLVVGAAAGGLAGVRSAPIVTTPENALSMEAKRTLTRYAPDSVILAGFANAETVSVQVSATLDANATVSNAFADSSAALVAYKMYSRTKRSGYWDATTTAFVAPAGDVSLASLAGSYAYRTKSPVFLAEDGQTLPASVAAELAGGNFNEVVLVGMAGVGAALVSQQLKEAGYSGAVRSCAAGDVYALSADLAQEQIDKGLGACDKATVVSAGDPASAVAAVSTCGENGAPLLFSDAYGQQGEAALAFLEANKYSMSQGYLFGTRQYLPDDLMTEIEKTCSAGSAQSLTWGAVALSHDEFAYDGEVHVPGTTVTSRNGLTLKEGVDYVLRYYDDATDAQVLLERLSAAGSYTVVAVGQGAYTGSCSAGFKIYRDDLSRATANAAGQGVVYGGSPKTVKISVSFDGASLVEGTDFRLLYENNVNAGTALVHVVGMGACKGEAACAFDIAPFDYSNLAKAALSRTSFTYTGKAVKPSATVTMAGVELVAGKDFALAYPSAVKAGTYQLAVKGTGNYTGSVNASFKVGKASQSVSIGKKVRKFKASALKKKAASFKMGAKAKTAVTYVVNGNNAKKYLKIAENGKVTVKKGTKKGSYKIAVKAKATTNYKSAAATVTVKVQ